MMKRERIIIVNGNKIEEYYWARKYVVFKNDKLIFNSFDKAVEIEKEAMLGNEIHAPVEYDVDFEGE